MSLKSIHGDLSSFVIISHHEPNPKFLIRVYLSLSLLFSKIKILYFSRKKHPYSAKPCCGLYHDVSSVDRPGLWPYTGRQVNQYLRPGIHPTRITSTGPSFSFCLSELVLVSGRARIFLLLTDRKTLVNMSGSGRKNARTRTRSSADASKDDDGDDLSLRQPKPGFRPRRDRGRNQSSLRIFNVDLKVMLGLSVLAFFVILFVIYNLIKPAEEVQRPRVVTPFPAPKIMDLPQVKHEFECEFVSMPACDFVSALASCVCFKLWRCRMDELSAMAVSRRAQGELVLGNLSASCLSRNSC